MRPADHVLLTRFNLPTPGPESLVRAQDDWLRGRVELFETYCLPSVRAQTSGAFTWIVYFDPASPAWLRARIDAWVLACGLHPVFREEVSGRDLLADLDAEVDRHHAEVITTNLDNDDGLAADFVARLQRAEVTAGPRVGDRDGGGRTALYCPQGLVLAGGRAYLHTDEHNAFCSVREPWLGARTCWTDWHNLLHRQMPVVLVDGGPAWLQVVHGSNVSNRVRGHLVAPAPHRAAFPGLLTGATAPPRTALAADRLVRHPARTVRDRGRGLARRTALGLVGKDGFDRWKTVLARRRTSASHS